MHTNNSPSGSGPGQSNEEKQRTNVSVHIGPANYYYYLFCFIYCFHIFLLLAALGGPLYGLCQETALPTGLIKMLHRIDLCCCNVVAQRDVSKSLGVPLGRWATFHAAIAKAGVQNFGCKFTSASQSGHPQTQWC